MAIPHRLHIAAILTTLVLIGAGCNAKTATTERTVNTGANNTATVTTISINDFAFNPKNIEVKVGTTVSWTNDDSASHIIVGDSGGPNSSTLATGDTYAYTFNTAGSFPYHCGIHSMMTGTVTVTQ